MFLAQMRLQQILREERSGRLLQLSLDALRYISAHEASRLDEREVSVIVHLLPPFFMYVCTVCFPSTLLVVPKAHPHWHWWGRGRAIARFLYNYAALSLITEITSAITKALHGTLISPNWRKHRGNVLLYPNMKCGLILDRIMQQQYRILYGISTGFVLRSGHV